MSAVGEYVYPPDCTCGHGYREHDTETKAKPCSRFSLDGRCLCEKYVPAEVVSETYRVLVTGSRTWDDSQAVFDALAPYNHGRVTLVHGSARGADTMAAAAARAFGWEVEAHPADWQGSYGKAAGFVRNAEMVKAGADVCLAFIKDGSRGATHCADLAEKAGIETRRFAS